MRTPPPVPLPTPAATTFKRKTAARSKEEDAAETRNKTERTDASKEAGNVE